MSSTESAAHPGYHVVDPSQLEDGLGVDRDFAIDVLVGLSSQPKRLPSKYHYDATGSRLFQRIMDLEEYYPTNCEQEILSAHAAAILENMRGGAFNLVDLGAGDGRKTRVLLEQMARQKSGGRYVPIDISEAAMRGLVEDCRERFSGLDVEGVVSEYFDGLRWLAETQRDRRNLVLFLGSNIGNFDKPRARAFLHRLWNALRPGDYVLVGFDLKKDIEKLLGAYNDREGITAQFNLNLLERINRELGGHFDQKKFRFFSTYDVFSGAMESYLVSLESQQVPIDALRRSFEFDAWEPVHTEYSYKYLETDVESLAADTGFIIEAQFYDERRWFVDSLWRVHKALPGAGR